MTLTRTLSHVAVIYVVWILGIRKRIPFATVMLSTSGDLAFKFPGMPIVRPSFGTPVLLSYVFTPCLPRTPSTTGIFAVALGVMIVGVALFCAFVCMALWISSSVNSTGAQIAIYIGVLLLFFWDAEVLTNIVFTTACGVCNSMLSEACAQMTICMLCRNLGAYMGTSKCAHTLESLHSLRAFTGVWHLVLPQS